MNTKNLWLMFVLVVLLVGLCIGGYIMKGLRQGIDLRGGHSLIFEIRTNEAEIERLQAEKKKTVQELDQASTEELKQQAQDRLDRIEADLNRYETTGMERGDLAQEMISILKERVDPRGLLSLEWTPLGANRIQIRMPAGKADTQQKRDAYLQALETLQDNNVQRSEIRSVLQASKEDRQGLIERLCRGESQQIERFQRLVEAYEEVSAARDALEEARAERIEILQQGASDQGLEKAEQAVRQALAAYEDAQILYESRTLALQEGNISSHRLMGMLDRYVSSAERGAMSAEEVRRREEIYRRELEELQSDYPARTGEIKQIVEHYETWADVRQELEDPADLKRLIAKAGVLEFRVAPYAPWSRMEETVKIPQEELSAYKESLRTDGPEALRERNDKYLWFPIRGEEEEYNRLVTARFAGKRYLLLYNQPGYVMLRQTGADSWSLAEASQGFDRQGQPSVKFTFDEPGAKRFSRLTSGNVGREMAILLDDEVYSAPLIKTTISKSGEITGRFTLDEVNDLVRTLRAGSLPARLNPEPVSESTFGPAIGAVNRQLGIRAGIWGLIAVAAFMLLYYLLAGTIADIALLLNIILIVGTMSWFGAVFTLPGIAGLILTIGIAVDANVLIFERLREEQAKGQGIRQALKNAYQRAGSAIFDANITTLLVCLILGWVGTEEVRGFAITLGLGVLFSLFTALLVTRWIFQLLLDLRLVSTPVFMLRILGIPKINWMSKRHFFWALSAIMVALGIASLVWQGEKIWGIEFSSGTQAIIQLRDDALVDGALPDDALVRQRFIQQARALGFDKLADTSRVETQLDPHRVRDFIQDYDDRENPDGIVSLAEWQGHKKDTAFFAQVDADGNELLTAEELHQTLPPAGFQISTTETKVNRIRDVAREAFGSGLQIRAKRQFERVAGRQVPELGIPIPATGLVRITPELRRQVNPAYREEILDYEQGVLFVIHQVRPAISKTELAQRIRQMRHQPDFPNQRLSPTDLIGLTPDQEDLFSSFAILVRPGEKALADRPGAWEDFATGEWQLIQAVLNREEAMVATNFDAAIAGETAGRAVFAVILSWLAIVVYLWLRFGNWRWGLAAVVCLIHDVIIVVGLVAASGWLFNTAVGEALGIHSFKIDLAMVAALLTVIGYSVNDTIVVFDRIRENRGKLTTVSPMVINTSINQTLARTLLTSGTTFIVVILMYVMGGAAIHAFSYALLMGILFGTYSSVAVASPLLMGFRKALVAKVSGAVAEGK